MFQLQWAVGLNARLDKESKLCQGDLLKKFLKPVGQQEDMKNKDMRVIGTASSKGQELNF